MNLLGICTAISFANSATAIMKISFFNAQMGNLSLIFIPLLFVIHYVQLCKVVSVCNVDANYTKASKFESNLNTVLNNLVQRASSNGFNTSVVGERPDIVYGLLQCRGDSSVEAFYNCSKEANTIVRQDCGSSVGGRVWLENCYLRYEKYNFTGKLDNSTTILYDVANASDPDVFRAAVSGFLKNLSEEAYRSPKRYSSATITYYSFEKIFGAVQCGRDISIDDCKTCLARAITDLLDNVGGVRLGGRAWAPSCAVRYELYRFFDSKHPPPPPQGDSFDFPSFYKALANIFSKLSAEASGSVNRYASGSIALSSSHNISVEVQCFLELSVKNCAKCLNAAINIVLQFIDTIIDGAAEKLEYCIVRYELHYSFFPSTKPPSTSPPSNPAPSKKFTNRTAMILGILGALLLALFAGPFAARRKLIKFARPGNSDIDKYSLLGQDQKMIYTMETLVAATRNFHDNNKLGQGGYGSVYKGTTSDGSEIAVKKLSLKSMQGENEFINEVKLVTKIQHRNLANLLGCCAEGRERLLVYQYLPNKSLHKILFGESLF